MNTDTLAVTEPAPRVIHGIKGNWEMVVGLEIHAQVASRSKLFSPASTEFGAAPNTNVHLIDAAMPGMLPVINAFCIEQAVRTGLGLNAKINLDSEFDRKNYFYPDLPQGYQISQLYHPITGPGIIHVDMGGDGVRQVRIDHIHLEQDAGKSLHDMDPELSFVDLNRAGVALMEIVTFPDIRSPEEAAGTILKLRQIMRYLGTCDGNMQNGNLRADVNVSVRPSETETFGTRCEIKNMNSTRFIQQAITYEANRQIAVIEDGGTVTQETRLFDPNTGRTRSMRSKEEAHDYRYFPCPDLLPLRLEQEWVDGLKADLPELPDRKISRFVNQYGIGKDDAVRLTAERKSADYFETVAQGRDGRQAANWIINELFGRLNKESRTIEDSPVSAEQIGEILDLISDGSLSGRMAKDLFDLVWSKGGRPAELVEAHGMKQMTDTKSIEHAVDRALNDHPEQAKKARSNPRVAGFFVGQVMKATNGQANPTMVNELVHQKLGH